jgi:Protein of unknown function (DUF2628)
MSTYVVMEPASDRRGEAALFIRDAFAPTAVVVPVFWLLWNRLWFESAMALLASFILVGASAWAGIPQLAGIASILIGFYVALEGSALKIAAARRRGCEEAAVVDARSIIEAEERYYLTRPLAQNPPIPTAILTTTPRQTFLPAAGLFALPGAH